MRTLCPSSMGARTRRQSTLHRLLGLAVAIAGTALTLAARPAHADLKFTNNYWTPVYVAVSYYYGSELESDPVERRFPIWRSMGWYRVDSGETFTFWRGSVAQQNRYWYAYAIAEDGSGEWSGDYSFRVDDTSAFDYIYSPTLYGQDGPSYSHRGFFQIDVERYDDFTWNLNP